MDYRFRSLVLQNWTSALGNTAGKVLGHHHDLTKIQLSLTGFHWKQTGLIDRVLHLRNAIFEVPPMFQNHTA